MLVPFNSMLATLAPGNPIAHGIGIVMHTTMADSEFKCKDGSVAWPDQCGSVLNSGGVTSPRFIPGEEVIAAHMVTSAGTSLAIFVIGGLVLRVFAFFSFRYRQSDVLNDDAQLTTPSNNGEVSSADPDRANTNDNAGFTITRGSTTTKNLRQTAGDINETDEEKGDGSPSSSPSQSGRNSPLPWFLGSPAGSNARRTISLPEES